jgi:hypothetical protein
VSVIAFLIGAAAAGAAAPGQSEFTAKETRRLLDDYGRCIVKRWPKVAAEAIQRNVDNKELVKRYKVLVDGSCLPVRGQGALRVKFEGDQYRYALADALVRHELAAVAPPVLDDVPQLQRREPVEPSKLSRSGKPLKPAQYAAAVRAYEQEQAFNYLSRYGECVVRVDPAAAKALLLTAPETPEESARFAAMSTAFATCVPEGRTMSFGKLALRGTIATNYYRLAMAARAATPTGRPR